MGNSALKEHKIPTETFEELLESLTSQDGTTKAEMLTALQWFVSTINGVFRHPNEQAYRIVTTTSKTFFDALHKFPQTDDMLVLLGYRQHRKRKHQMILGPTATKAKLLSCRKKIVKAITKVTDGVAYRYAYLPHMDKGKWKARKKLLQTKVDSIQEFCDLLKKFGTPSGKTELFAELDASCAGEFFKAYFSKKCCKKFPDRAAEKEEFLSVIVPFILSMALRTEELFPERIPILFETKDNKLVLTRTQVACLLSHFFLGTLPHPSAMHVGMNFNDCSFTPLFYSSHVSSPKGNSDPNESIILCILEYFRRRAKKIPSGNIIIHRKVGAEDVKWEESKKPIVAMTVDDETKIEDSKAQFHADFANRTIGGGALSGGCVQEEILFALKPECYVAMFLCPTMGTKEAIMISGAERFSKYSGYAAMFKYEGSYKDKTKKCELDCLNKHIFAMDSVVNLGNDQLLKPYVLRDINKAYIAMSNPEQYDPGENPSVATGNWGCGAFGGYLELKAIQQLIAASQVGIDISYHTFNKPEFAQALTEFVSFCTVQNKITVGELLEAVLAYQPTKKRCKLFKHCKEYIKNDAMTEETKAKEITE